MKTNINTANTQVDITLNKKGNTMKTNITLNQIIASVNIQAVKSTAHFNEAYDKAEKQWPHEMRSNVEFTERALYKLSRQIKDGYNNVVSEFVAEIAHTAVETGDLARFEQEVTHLVNWNNFCEAALHKTQRRMQMKNLHDIALFSVREGETWKTIDDVDMLLSTLEDEVTLNQLLISNSGSVAHHYMKPVLELEETFKKEWDVVCAGVVKKATGRVKRGLGSKTDDIVLGKSTMTTYMMPFVLNRFLNEITKQEVRLSASIDFMEEKKEAAIKETDGRAGEHRDRKVAGYSDLSREELGPKGFTNTADVKSGQTARYYEEGNEELGIMGINEMRDIVQAMHVFENTILELIDHKLSAAFANAEIEHPAKATYAYKMVSEGVFDPITSKQEAADYLAEQRKQFIEQQRKQRLITREDTARYDAMNMHVPTFNL